MDLCIRKLSFLDWNSLSLTIASGEVVCLMGESGSGKSLLLRAIADLVLNDGDIVLGDERRESFAAPDWRKRVGYLPAEILWWEDTVGEHFHSLPSSGDLKRLKLPGDAIDWSPSRLSMGERQRLGILRMLDRRPKVLLLDEPTANLDEDSASVVESTILEYLKEHAANALWVTHSLDQASRVGNRVLELKGKSIEKLNCRDASK